MTFVAHLITNGIVSRIHAISKKTTTSEANGQDSGGGCPPKEGIQVIKAYKVSSVSRYWGNAS